MSQDTQGFIVRRVGYAKIGIYLQKMFGNVEVISEDSTYCVFSFKDHGDFLLMNVYNGMYNGVYGTITLNKTGLEVGVKDGTVVSLGARGNAVEIITDMVKYFGGGYIDKNDCDDIDFEEV